MCSAKGRGARVCARSVEGGRFVCACLLSRGCEKRFLMWLLLNHYEHHM